MPVLKALEPGVMFWATPDPLAKIQEVKSLGARAGQLGIAGDYELASAAEPWKAALAAEDFALITVFGAYNGEDYADIPTVMRTVGFIPESTRAEREARTLAVSDFAAAIGVKSIACHAGFIPHDPSHPNYIVVRDLVRRICDHAAKNGQTFTLETGQEPAAALLHFFEDVQRPNLGINFDPANMILYGTGDPIEALGVLGKHVISVHAKDGDWPPRDQPGALGTERRLGEGSVGMERFVAKLKEIGFTGTLNIEREGRTGEQWQADVKDAITLLARLAG